MTQHSLYIERSRKKGFSLIETLAIIGVMAIMATIGIGAFRRERSAAALTDASSTLVRQLEGARSRASSGFGESDHGVHIEEKKLTVFEGVVYTGAGTEILLAPTTATDQTDMSVIFKRLSGTTSPVTIHVSGITGDTKTIQVTEDGMIYQEN